MLDDARHRADRRGSVGALADEHRQHQLARPRSDGLGDQPAQRRACAAAGRGRDRSRDSAIGRGSLRASDLAARGRLALGRPGDRLAGLEHRGPTRGTEVGERVDEHLDRRASGASTSTRRPCSSAVLAVAGPITAITVEGCGLPAMPTRLRTVEDDVNTTASNLPVLIASRVGAGGGAARTVR